MTFVESSAWCVPHWPRDGLRNIAKLWVALGRETAGQLLSRLNLPAWGERRIKLIIRCLLPCHSPCSAWCRSPHGPLSWAAAVCGRPRPSPLATLCTRFGPRDTNQQLKGTLNPCGFCRCPTPGTYVLHTSNAHCLRSPLLLILYDLWRADSVHIRHTAGERLWPQRVCKVRTRHP
jgi:hypothetical protein